MVLFAIEEKKIETELDLREFYRNHFRNLQIMVIVMKLAPSKIRFMHDRITSKFSNRATLNDTINRIESGSMNVYDLPKIRVVRRNGFYYAFDNRRLYVYRVLEHRGMLDKVKVKLAPLSKFKRSYFTTKNNGQSIRLTRGVTLTHSHATSPPSSPET